MVRQVIDPNPSGTYQETGTETFVGCLANGTTCGTFGTTFRFEAKFAPDGTEIFGRCQHPIVRGSGTRGLGYGCGPWLGTAAEVGAACV